MLSSGAGTVIATVVLSVIAAAAVTMGFIFSGLLGLRWSARVGALDAFVGVSGAIVGMVALVATDGGEGAVLFGSAAVGVSCVVLRHVLRRFVHRANDARAP
jgi:hypothetical protein